MQKKKRFTAGLFQKMINSELTDGVESSRWTGCISSYGQTVEHKKPIRLGFFFGGGGGEKYQKHTRRHRRTNNKMDWNISIKIDI